MRRDPFLPLVALLCLAGLGIALVSQHVFDMQPCAWCTFQRLVYLLIGVVAAIGWWRQAQASKPRSRFSVLAAISALLSAAGLVSALYQHFVASRSQSCAMTLADQVIKSLKLDEGAPWLFKATAFCHEANIDLLRVPYAIWSAALFALLLFLSLRAAWRAVR